MPWSYGTAAVVAPVWARGIRRDRRRRRSVRRSSRGRVPLPVLAIPTTAGTGSEVSPSAVRTDTERKKKMNLFDMRNCPRIALVDPDLTLPARDF